MTTDPSASFAFLSEPDPQVKPDTISGEKSSLAYPGSAPATLDYHPTPSVQPSAPGPKTIPAIPGYTFLQELGRGGMGVVYLARQEKLQRLVALKMLLGGTWADKDALRRFRAEAEIVAQLRHPNIVQIYDLGEWEGHAYFTMELLPGGSLLKRQAEQPLTPREAAALVRTLALALQVVHAKGILHRDMKPANVLLGGEAAGGRGGEAPAAATSPPLHLATVKITDFGLAKQVQAEGWTETGMLMGTPEYMAPEQAKGDKEQLGPAADIYSLGAMLYEFLVGRPPFRGFSPLETVMQVMTQEPIPPSRLQPGTPPELETICLKCLEKDPVRRYASAQELADELQRFLQGEPILARPAGPVERALKWARRKPAWAALGATVLLALVLLSVGVVLLLSANAEEARQRQRAEDNAAQAAANAKRAAAAQKLAEDKERQARENYRTAQEAVDKLFVQVMDTNLLKAEAMQEVRKLLLREALPLCERLLQQQGDDPHVLLSVARNHLRIGIIIKETSPFNMSLLPRTP
jgi:hypothetical protein